ncbi:MAG: leucine-rich repeat domain-containing protein [Faecousia sp.]
MKMKLLLLALLFLLSGCSADYTPLPSQQQEQQEDNIWNNSFEYQVHNGEVTITYVLIDEETIVIPDEIMNLPVTCIGETACTHKQHCTQIILPDTLKSISDSAFYRCTNLNQISIPANVCSIGENPFFRCSSLEAITVDENNQYYCSIDGILYDKSVSELLAYPEGLQNDHYSVPQSVVSINRSAFGYYTYLHTIYIGSNVTALPAENMFAYPDEITLIVEGETAAAEYAQTHFINYKIVE